MTFLLVFIVLHGGFFRESASLSFGGNVGFNGGINAGYGYQGNWGNGYWCQQNYGVNLNRGGQNKNGAGANFGFGQRNGGGYGMTGNVGYGGYGFNGNAQINSGGWSPPKPGCCYYIDFHGQRREQCGDGERQGGDGETSPSDENQDSEKQEELEEAEEEKPEEKECRVNYCYDTPQNINTIILDDNEYTTLDSSISSASICINRLQPCTFTWQKEITNETDLAMTWLPITGWWKPSRFDNFCAAANEPPGSMAYNAFKFIVDSLTNGVTECPIPPGSIEIQLDNISFKLGTDEKIICSSSYQIHVFLPKNDNRPEDIVIVNIAAMNEVPEDGNCMTNEEAKKEAKKHKKS